MMISERCTLLKYLHGKRLEDNVDWSSSLQSTLLHFQLHAHFVYNFFFKTILNNNFSSVFGKLVPLAAWSSSSVLIN